MNIKANVDFIHNGQPVKQAEVIGVPQEDGEALVHSGLAFETKESALVAEYIGEPTQEPSPEQSKPKTKKKNQPAE